MLGFLRKFKPSKPPEHFTPPRIDFIGEQAGPVEDELKEKFCAVFSATPTVKSAYLARVSYGEPTGYSVSLCIRSTLGVDERLQHRLGEIFTSSFRKDQHLDTLFLREDQEARLKKVCKAFYEKG